MMTREEALGMMREWQSTSAEGNEAIAMAIASLEVERPAKGGSVVSFRVSREVLVKLTEKARAEGIPVGQLVSRIVTSSTAGE